MTDIIGGFTKIFDWVMDLIYKIAEIALLLLPDSPIQKSELFEGIKGPFSQVMGHINYFVPVGTMLGIMTAYLVAVGVWYVCRWFLRLAKYID